jgi:hypothetical protein
VKTRPTGVAAKGAGLSDCGHRAAAPGAAPPVARELRGSARPAVRGRPLRQIRTPPLRPSPAAWAKS